MKTEKRTNKSEPKRRHRSVLFSAQTKSLVWTLNKFSRLTLWTFLGCEVTSGSTRSECSQPILSSCQWRRRRVDTGQVHIHTCRPVRLSVLGFSHHFTSICVHMQAWLTSAGADFHLNTASHPEVILRWMASLCYVLSCLKAVGWSRLWHKRVAVWHDGWTCFISSVKKTKELKEG